MTVETAVETSGGCHWWPLPLLSKYCDRVEIVISFIYCAVICIYVVIAVTGGAVAGTYFTHTGAFARGSTTSTTTGGVIGNEPGSASSGPITITTCDLRGQYFDASSNKCKMCPSASKTFAVFWQSQTDGCMNVS